MIGLYDMGGDRERHTDRRYAATENNGEPNLSDQKLAELKAQAQNRRKCPVRRLPDGRIVMDLGLTSFNDNVVSVRTAFELPSTNGQRHFRGPIESIPTLD